jgi:hypothetical protein
MIQSDHGTHSESGGVCHAIPLRTPATVSYCQDSGVMNPSWPAIMAAKSLSRQVLNILMAPGFSEKIAALIFCPSRAWQARPDLKEKLTESHRWQPVTGHHASDAITTAGICFGCISIF